MLSKVWHYCHIRNLFFHFFFLFSVEHDLSFRLVTYSEAINFLYGLRWFGMKPGLANTLKLAALAGNPHHHLRFIHVAGTNGKGSTCAMLESIYRAAGLRVGLFTSPHLVAFGERIQVNRRLIGESEVVRLVGQMLELLDQGWGKLEDGKHPSSRDGSVPEPDPRGPGGPRSATHPTFFEVVTVMALRHFLEQKCDLVIWETGLGGRLDATNIVTPLASVITNIQHDHQQWLGNTLASIAAEKAGIIKTGVPVITAEDNPEALAVIEQTARHQNSPLTRVMQSETNRPPLDTLELPLLGRHQRLNAAVTVATVRTLPARRRAQCRRRSHPGRCPERTFSRPETRARFGCLAGQGLAGYLPNPGAARRQDTFSSGQQRTLGGTRGFGGGLPSGQPGRQNRGVRHFGGRAGPGGR